MGAEHPWITTEIRHWGALTLLQLMIRAGLGRLAFWS